MGFETLEVEIADGVARIWLARPASLNALNPRALDEIAQIFDQLQTRFDIKVAVLGGRGRAFSAGADRKDPPGRLAAPGSGSGARERRWIARLGQRALEAIERCEVVTIARLHGHVVGGGFVLALGCDLRVAAQGTNFHIPEVDLGIPLTWGAVPRLVRELGAARARELILLAERFDAARAAEIGLVNRVVAENELDATVDGMVRSLCAKPEWALHMTKTQFLSLGHASQLGDAGAGDGDLLAAAAAEDPRRFLFPKK